MVLLMENKISVNTRIYTSIEEVISDYEKREYVNSLIFFGYFLSSPIRISENGDIKLGVLEGSVSDAVWLLMDATGPLRGIDRNFLVRASEFVPIMEKWSRLGLAYNEGVYKMIDFIRNGGYKWIAHSLEDYLTTSKISYLSHEDCDKSLVEELRSAMVSAGEDFLSSLIEQVFRGWEGHLVRHIERSTGEKKGFDFDIGESLDSFYSTAKEAEEFFREPKNIFSWSYKVKSRMVAIFGSLWGILKDNRERGKFSYEKVFKYSNKDEKFLDREREKYKKIGVLPLLPEIFLFSEISEPYGLSFMCSSPKILESGIVLLGHRKVKGKDHELEMLFAPFVAARTEPAVALFRYVREPGSDDPEQRPTYYYPVLMAYESEASRKKKPKFQIFSFAYGPVISSKCRTTGEDTRPYAPLVEHVYTPRSGDKEIGVRRGFAVDMERVYEYYGYREDRKFYERLLSKVLKMTDFSHLSKAKQRVVIDLTERNKIVELLSFLGEMLKKVEQERKEKRKGGSGFALINPSEINPSDGTKSLTESLCYSVISEGKPQRVQVKMIEEFTEEEKELMKTGASVGGHLSINPDEAYVYFDKVERLYDLLLASFRKVFQLGSRYKNLKEHIKIIEELSKVSKEVREKYRVSPKVGKKEIGLITRKSEVSSGIDIARIAKIYLPELSKKLEETDGPNITVAFEYGPKMEIYFPRAKCQGVSLDSLMDKEELDMADIHILSYLRRAMIFFDFEEEGLRVASINVVSII